MSLQILPAKPDVPRLVDAVVTGTVIRRIGIFRALQLGDMLCAVPALRAVRHAFPQAHITLIGLPWAQTFVDRFAHYVDDFLVFPGGQGLPERVPTPDEDAAFLRERQRVSFDLLLQLHGSGAQSNAIVEQIAAHTRAGFYASGDRCPDAKFFIPYPEQEAETRRLLRLVEHLGVSVVDDSLEFPIFAHEWRAAAELRANYGLSLGHYACLHPGARAASRRWPPERFARLGDRLAARGLQVVLSGIAEESDITRAVARSMQSPCIDLTGLAPIGIAAALFTGARVVVCNDTGVSHVAAALNAPSVVIYLDSSPQRWAMGDEKRHRRVIRPRGVEEVWEEVVRLL